MKDYYNILNVSPDASLDEIRRAFRALAMSCHPDLAGETLAGSEAFIEIREAYETLIDAERREEYNRSRSASQRNLRRSASSSSSINSSSFDTRSANGVTRPTRPTARPRPAPRERKVSHDAVFISGEQCKAGPNDITGTLEVALEDSLFPSTYTVTLANNLDKPEESYRYTVRVPGKLWKGCSLVIEGLGYYQPGGRKPPGNLIIEVEFAKHELFRLCGETVFYDLTIMPWEAALGFTAEVPTLEGVQNISIPPCISTPTVKRLQNAGIYRRNNQRGDFWINMKVEISPPMSYRARRLWAELAQEYRHSTRKQ